MPVNLTSIRDALKNKDSSVFKFYDAEKKLFHLPWYDDANEPGGVMFIGQDFGNVKSAKAQCEERSNNKDWIPKCGGNSKGNDRSYRRLFDKVIHCFKDIPVYCANSSYYLRSEEEDEVGLNHDQTHWEQSKRILKKEIELVKPKLIISLGSIVHERLIELYGLKITFPSGNELRCHPLDDSFPNLIFSYHPCYFSNNYAERLVQEIEKEWANAKQPSAVG